MRGVAGGRRHEPGRPGKLGPAGGGVERGPDVHAAAQGARHVGTARERPGAEDDELEAGELGQGASSRPQALRLVGAPLEHEAVARLGRRVDGDAERQHLVVARETSRRRLGDLVRGRGQGVRAREQPLPLGLSRGIAEPLGRVEGRHREPAAVAESEVREARHAGVVRVHEVELVGGEREREVRPNSDGHPEATPPGDWDGGAHRDGSFERPPFALEPAEGAATLREILRAARRSKHDDLVAARPERRGCRLDVLVHRVWPRPRERRHHADP